MIEKGYQDQSRVSTQEALARLGREKLDLIVLRSMAKKLAVTLHTLEQPLDASLPISYAFEERRGRAHRMIICAPRELATASDLHMVGFVSNRRQEVDPGVTAELFQIDQAMLGQLIHMPGLLSYSSLELRAGNWYNLVVFQKPSSKEYLGNMATHRYAAYQLSPIYYEWIRLHTGTMSGGLSHQEIGLRSTKYYFFAETLQAPIVHEIIYEV